MKPSTLNMILYCTGFIYASTVPHCFGLMYTTNPQHDPPFHVCHQSPLLCLIHQPSTIFHCNQPSTISHCSAFTYAINHCSAFMYAINSLNKLSFALPSCMPSTRSINSHCLALMYAINGLLLWLHVCHQMPIECLAPNGHLNLVKGILHDIVGIQLIHTPDDNVDIWLVRLRKDEEFGPYTGISSTDAGENAREPQPVNVWKHCILKWSLSSTSRPPPLPPDCNGDIREVMAWTP
jgi:hypothetical protein